MKRTWRAVLSLLAGISLGAGVFAAEPRDASPSAGHPSAGRPSAGRPYSPWADLDYPAKVYFGDTHVHTGLSADAGGSGTRLMPDDAYRFARGEQVVSNSGQPVRLRRPYDFFLITDHSDGMGLITDILGGAPNIMADADGRVYHDAFLKGGDTAQQAVMKLIGQFAQGKISPGLMYQPGNPAYGRVWELASIGYARGVPMGSDLARPAAIAGAPRFLVYALRDPDGANLDRIQIVKGWLDAAGDPREKIYDVTWAGDRAPGADGRLPPVGDTVDLSIPSWTNSIGAAELGTVWTDPDFDPKQRAFYYARVIEVPTPRWTAYDQVKFGLDLPDNIPLKTQERAYTSPIWYNP